jgi:hypothetical protein
MVWGHGELGGAALEVETERANPWCEIQVFRMVEVSAECGQLGGESGSPTRTEEVR